MSLPNTAAGIRAEIERLNGLRDEHSATRLRLLREVNDLARSIVAIDQQLDNLAHRYEMAADAETDLMQQVAEQSVDEEELVEGATAHLVYQKGKHRFNIKPAKRPENQSNPSGEEQPK